MSRSVLSTAISPTAEVPVLLRQKVLGEYTLLLICAIVLFPLVGTALRFMRYWYEAKLGTTLGRILDAVMAITSRWYYCDLTAKLQTNELAIISRPINCLP